MLFLESFLWDGVYFDILAWLSPCKTVSSRGKSQGSVYSIIVRRKKEKPTKGTNLQRFRRRKYQKSSCLGAGQWTYACHRPECGESGTLSATPAHDLRARNAYARCIKQRNGSGLECSMAEKQRRKRQRLLEDVRCCRGSILFCFFARFCFMHATLEGAVPCILRFAPLG